MDSIFGKVGGWMDRYGMYLGVPSRYVSTYLATIKRNEGSYKYIRYTKCILEDRKKRRPSFRYCQYEMIGPEGITLFAIDITFVPAISGAIVILTVLDVIWAPLAIDIQEKK